MKKIGRYLIYRSGYTIITLFFISIITFAVTQVLPGNAARMILGQYATDEQVNALAQQMGLNRPLYVQYFDWISGVVVGDWGQSLIIGGSVMELVVPRFIRSLQLAIMANALVIAIAIPLGVFAAVNREGLSDKIITTGSYIGVSLPEYVTGTILLLVFAGPYLSVFPNGQYVPLREGAGSWLSHMVLPTITLTIILLAHTMRQTRSAMIETLESEYIRTARLKGNSEWRVILHHALQNALLPTITVLALNFGWLMGGIIIVEEVFAFPGLGRLTIRAIRARDLPVIQMTVLIISFIYIFANLAADLMYTYLDPRIELGGA